MYGANPPAGAANALQSQVSRLRRGLRAAAGQGGLVELHPAGYRLAVDPEDVDAHRFERLAREGGQALAAGDHVGAAVLLRAALDLWRGPALADVRDAPFAGPAGGPPGGAAGGRRRGPRRGRAGAGPAPDPGPRAPGAGHGASALTAYASSAEPLIAARALLGVAGATIMPSSLSLLRRAFTDPRQRTMVIGIFSGVGGLAVGLGPVLGGVVLDHFWWGAVFVINVPLMVLAFVVGLVTLPESRDPPPRQRAERRLPAQSRSSGRAPRRGRARCPGLDRSRPAERGRSPRGPRRAGVRRRPARLRRRHARGPAVQRRFRRPRRGGTGDPPSRAQGDPEHDDDHDLVAAAKG